MTDLARAARGQMPGLDGLRGLAILLVMLHSFDVIAAQGGLGHQLDLALDAGWIGVQLFFVLSGFLITGILLDTRDRAGYFRGFFARRVLRIFPLYYAVLLVAFVVIPAVTSVPAGHGDHQVWLWCYLSNFAQPLGHGEPSLPHFWSLAVEEQFYLVWPLVVYLAGRRGVIAVALAMVVAAIAARFAIRAHWGPEAAYTFTPCRMDALAVGALLAALVRGERTEAAIARWPAGTLVIAGTIVVAAGLAIGRLQRLGEAMQTIGYTPIALGFAIVVAGAIAPGTRTARILAFAPLRRVGTYSYGMYVLHAPLHVYVGVPLLARVTHEPGVAAALLYTAAASIVTFAAAAVSYHLFERRFLALKDRLAPR